jgi:glutamate racemase
MKSLEKIISTDPRPIGVFDSGIGGLTVLKAFISLYPHESYVYIGDTARLPYGTKSPETIIRYSCMLAETLCQMDIKAMVVACNTASTHALKKVEAQIAPLPVMGMIDPAVETARSVTKNKHIAVIGTRGTIQSDIYAKNLRAQDPDLRISSKACQLLVAYAEDGLIDGPLVSSILDHYLDEIFSKPDAPDTLILGCTHFPLFEPLLRQKLGSRVALVNTGLATAKSLARYQVFRPAPLTQTGVIKFFATDGPEYFAKNAERFFGQKLGQDQVEFLDIKVK